MQRDDIKAFCLRVSLSLRELDDDKRLAFLKAEIKKLPTQYQDLASTMLVEGIEIGGRANAANDVPTWYPKAGVFFGGIALAFLMGIFLLKGFGDHEANETGLLVLDMIVAFSTGMTFNFLGGDAFAKAELQIPGIKKSALTLGAIGAVAAIVLVFVILRQF